MAKAKKTKTTEEQEEKEEQEIAEKSVEESVEKHEEKKTNAGKAVKKEAKPEKKAKSEKEAEEKKEAEEGEKEFKLYTIPLREAFNVPKSRRASKAIKVIKEFLKRHTKSDVKLTGPLNEAVWDRGIKKPPRRIRVKVTEKEGIKIAKLAE